MANTMGQRLSDERSGAGLLVTRAGEGSLSFGASQDGAALVLGRRFSCATCGTTVLCIKAGEATAICCGAAMQQVEAKPLPSSD
jgi:streptomycin 6-kinase